MPYILIYLLTAIKNISPWLKAGNTTVVKIFTKVLDWAAFSYNKQRLFFRTTTISLSKLYSKHTIDCVGVKA